jgi:predicted Zn-dependent protease
MNLQNKGFYQDGITGLQQVCELALVNGNLYVYLIEQDNKLLIWKVKQFNSCAFQGTSLIIFFGHNPVQTIEITGDLANTIYNEWSGNPNIETEKSSSKSNRTILYIAVFACGFLFWSWVYLIPWLGEKSTKFIPIDLEIKMGEGIAESIRETNELSDSASYFANRFVESLELDDTYPISIQVIKSEELNAFALPGGKIFIYSALIEKMNTSEELVALLGHEISHITNRHSLKSICRSAASSVEISSFFGNAGGMTSGIMNQVDQFKSLDYSRDLETEADLSGLQIMIQNKVDPKGMLRLLQILKEASQEEPGIMKYLSTHPDTEARIQSVTSEIKNEQSFSKNENLESIFKSLQASFLEQE